MRFLSLLLLACYLFASNDAYRYLNDQRVKAKLPKFSRSATLEKSAADHAQYLAKHNISGHYQTQKGSKYFTGEKPVDRMLHRGWESRVTLENVATGYSDPARSIDGLFTAIYHRIAFLDFYADSVGFAVNKNSVVFNMGNHKLNELCKTTNDKSGYYKVCKDESKFIESDRFLEARDYIAKKAEKIIVYPANKQADASPAFFDESPEPLPSHKVSGNPISLHFNPYYFDDEKIIQLESFLLLENCKNSISNIIYLNHKNDPNRLLSRRDFVFFPNDRLKFDTKYCVEASFAYEGEKIVKKWSFHTQKPDGKLLIVEKNLSRKSFDIEKNKLYTIYLEPRSKDDTHNKISYQTEQGTKIALDRFDKNTVTIKVASPYPRGKVKLDLGDREVELSF